MKPIHMILSALLALSFAPLGAGAQGVPTIWMAPQSCPEGTATNLYIRTDENTAPNHNGGPDFGRGTNPQAGHCVAIYQFFYQNWSRPFAWAYNPVLTKSVAGSISGIEVDIQNDYAPDYHHAMFPWTTLGQNGHAVAFGAVLNGNSPGDGSAAFSATVNGSTARLWRYGYHVAGVRDKAIYIGGRSEHPNGMDTNVGNADPAVGLFNDTNAPVLVKSIGWHQMVIDTHTFKVYGDGSIESPTIAWLLARIAKLEADVARLEQGVR